MAVNVFNTDIDKFSQILEQVTVRTNDNTFTVKPEIGVGKFNRYAGKFWDLSIGDFKLKQDLHYQRQANKDKGKYSIAFHTFKSSIEETAWPHENIKRASEGIVFYSNTAKVNSIWHKNTECQMVYLGFSIEWVHQLEKQVLLPKDIGELMLERENPMFHVPLTSDSKHSLRQIFHPPSEIENNFLPAYLYGKVVDLFIQAASGTLQRVNRQVKHLSIHPDDLNTLEQVKISLINNYQEPPTVADLVDTTGMSKSKIQRLFQAVYGTSVYQFIKNVRMEKAMDLLVQGHSVTEAGYDVGYSSIPNFSAAFKEHYKQSPKSIGKR